MKWAFWTFCALYAGAFLLFLMGTFGWFGQDKDPLSGVFLIPLGLPWNLLADRLDLGGLVSGMLAPALNAGILFWFWKRH
ncbi:hypothetical protein [Novosphingobium album (ex Hu et al. 2023)]|uniref:Uncharacterized protein n=1 Tax=Novosphingobium album (ex Hu et al. 2023) TaxID=2930093 RepID=A0ABT0B0I5_9SPHN|nr:hypothetical protein [Novosphingobium album (ex Hu et al. 2023)]MCJ2178586.1 hypothetical protein [Novosphingobium album (ex Hu et al. 2023)]